MSKIWQLSKPYRCKHCGKPYVILGGHREWRYVPADYKEGFDLNDSYFDKTKHVSHFLSCKGLAGQWEEITKSINAQNRNNNEN